MGESWCFFCGCPASGVYITTGYAQGVLEVFDASRHAQHIALGLSLYCSDKGLGYAFGSDTAAEAMRLSKS